MVTINGGFQDYRCSTINGTIIRQSCHLPLISKCHISSCQISNKLLSQAFFSSKDEELTHECMCGAIIKLDIKKGYTNLICHIKVKNYLFTCIIIIANLVLNGLSTQIIKLFTIQQFKDNPYPNVLLGKFASRSRKFV